MSVVYSVKAKLYDAEKPFNIPLEEWSVDEKMNIHFKDMVLKTFSSSEIKRHIDDLVSFVERNGAVVGGELTLYTKDVGMSKVMIGKGLRCGSRMTFNQKLDLCKQYYDEKGVFPTPGEEYRGVKLGNFYQKLSNEHTILTRLYDELGYKR